MKENAISIHIGLNEIDNKIFKTNGRLKGCENDAEFMYKLAKSKGFSAELLRSSDEITDETGKIVKKSSYDYVKKKLYEARENLSDDGILFITFSGHGTQRENKINIFDYEPDKRDECWILHDGLLFDDELSLFFERFEEKNEGFKESQRILIISDSCHSGTIGDPITNSFFEKVLSDKNLKINLDNLSGLGIDTENLYSGLSEIYYSSSTEYNEERYRKDKNILEETLKVSTDDIFSGNRFRRIRKESLEKNSFFKDFGDIYNAREEEIYNYHSQNVPKELITKDLVKASIITISACQDWQIAKDGDTHGVFTQALKDVLIENDQIEVEANGNVNLLKNAKPLNYLQLHEAIWKKLKYSSPPQTPNYEKLGSPNAAFEMENWLTT